MVQNAEFLIITLPNLKQEDFRHVIDHEHVLHQGNSILGMILIPNNGEDIQAF